MYLAHIETDRERLLQGVLRLSWPPDWTGNFQRRYRASLRAASGLAMRSVGLALDIAPDGRLTSTHSFITGTDMDRGLRQALAALMRLDGTDGARAEIPGDATELMETFLGEEGPRHAPNTRLQETTGGAALLPPFALMEALGPITTALRAHGLGARIEYAVAPLAPAPETLRAALHRTARLDAVRAPGEVVSDQIARAEALRLARHHAVETLQAGGEARRVIEDALGQSALGAFYGPVGLEPRLELASPETEEALTYLAHPNLLAPEAEPDPAGFVASETAHGRAMGQSLIGEGESAAEAVTPIESLIAGDPHPVETDEAPYLFLSYAHKDDREAQELLDMLDRMGARVWYDDGLLGGSHWDTQLEAKILGAAGVICLVTEPYIASRICQREMKFADVLEKPLFVLTEPDLPFSGGLAMILASLQYVDRRLPDASDRLHGALMRHAPGVLASDPAEAKA